MPKLTKFIILNTSFTLSGLVYYYLRFNLYLVYLFTLFKNSGLLYLLFVLSKKYNHVKKIEIKVTLKDIVNVFMVSLTDTLTIVICKKSSRLNYMQEIVFFILYSFIFEIIFDFFHYCTHRLVHTKYVYKWVHKKHHEYHSNTNILTTFHQDPLDLVFTNVLPMYLASAVFPLSHRQYFIFLMFKTYIEISGHLGKDIKSYSFSQCMWVSKFFDIQLYNLDHYNHHRFMDCNYSKRFNIWDKIFGTFKHE
jgi:sterol desaturase/sphingolipid hydroxylase (fatty acid hydroxylase superfamily)